MNKLKDAGKLITTPSKSYDDRILLESAKRLNAAIVSNDFFRKFNNLNN
jgi:predicted nucleic acid-binding protein